VFISGLAVFGYMLNGWSFGDALYMVVLTVFTVGFSEVRPVDTVTLRTITVILIVIGCTGMIYLTGALIEKAGSGVFERPRPETRVYPGDGVTIIGRGDRANVLSKFRAPAGPNVPRPIEII